MANIPPSRHINCGIWSEIYLICVLVILWFFFTFGVCEFWSFALSKSVVFPCHISWCGDTFLAQEFEGRPKKGELEGDAEEEDVECISRTSIPHMFCKTLTASDTSTHGGFSVPRRAAEDCFPPLVTRHSWTSSILDWIFFVFWHLYSLSTLKWILCNIGHLTWRTLF